jgi:hypothetical protein
MSCLPKVSLYASTNLIQMPEIVSSIIVPFFRSFKVPVKRFLGIYRDTLSPG